MHPLTTAWLGLLLLSFGAAAADDADLKLARSLMRPGYDLVGMEKARLLGPDYVKDWSHEAERFNLLVRDINGDGLKDLFMAVEENPKFEDAEGRPCVKDSAGCRLSWGDRAIEVHYGQPDGSYRLGVRSGLIMDGMDGGMDPDPFDGFTLAQNGSIRVHFSGGAGWVWEYGYSLQFRKDDIYVVGASAYECNGARDDVECFKAEVNLLTGRWWRRTWVGDGEHAGTQKGKLKQPHLYRLKDAFPNMDPCAPPPRPDYDSTMHAMGGPQTGFSCGDAPR